MKPYEEHYVSPGMDAEEYYNLDEGEFNENSDIYNEENDLVKEANEIQSQEREDFAKVNKRKHTFGDYGYATGNKVVALQRWLNATILRNGKKLAVDGIYGPNTRAAVVTLQKFINANLPTKVKVDGYYGVNTYKAALKLAKNFRWPAPPAPVYGSLPSPALPKPNAPSAPNIHVAEPQESFFSKYKYFLLGGGLLLVAAGVILMMKKKNKKSPLDITRIRTKRL